MGEQGPGTVGLKANRKAGLGPEGRGHAATATKRPEGREQSPVPGRLWAVSRGLS